MAGPSQTLSTIIGLNGNPTDFPVRPTVAGAPFTIPSPYSTPTLTTSSPQSTGAVTVQNQQLVVWNTLSNLDFTAVTTPTASGIASFLINLPGRSTNFTNIYDVKVWVQGKDSATPINVVNNCIGFATISGTTAQINFNVNGSSNFVPHILDVKIQYSSV